MNQLQIHNKIDEFIKAGTKNASIKIALGFISFNEDSKRYFFYQADESWLEWSFENNLFVELTKKSENISTYRYRLPELDYLTRMAEKKSQLVADIIISISISEETFNPEVIDRFLWITGLLPVEQIRQILPKILKEEWIVLMSNFNRSGYEYQKMVEKLNEAKDFESLIILSKILLTVQNKEESKKEEGFSFGEKIFYLSNISVTGIFDSLVSVENTKKEEALEAMKEILSSIVNINKNKIESETIFDKSEPFYLLDVDIFNLELDSMKRSHFKEDIQNFIATIKTLIRDVFEINKDNGVGLRLIYSKYIESLPDSLTCWRLKLYAITIYPDIFKNEIKVFLFRVFNVGERHFEIDSGAEYHQGLIAGFNSLNNEDKEEYVEKVFEYYGATLEDKDKEKWRKRDGLEILTYIKSNLNLDQKTKAESIFGSFPEDGFFKPHPSIGEMRSGTLTNKSPFDPTSKTIDEIIIELKTNATPDELKKRYQSDDSFFPRNAEGLGDAIRDDFKNRIDDYFNKINNFFDRENIAPVYLYSIFREIDEMLRNNKEFTDEQYIKIFDLLNEIKISGESNEFKKSEEKSWLPDWISVHKMMADILLNILDGIKSKDIFNNQKTRLFGLIDYLLHIKSSPDSEDEKNENSEPAGIAINSVRGQAYRCFIQYIYNEGPTSLISQEEKDLFEEILENEKSTAVYFTIGQFIGAFYKDKEYFSSILDRVFPINDKTKDILYFASWEGYLSNSLYKELFKELEKYYEYAINLEPTIYPTRKYLRGLDESIAVHLALAYIHFEFNKEDELFKLFWDKQNETRHYEFISFIGRSYLTISKASDEWFKEQNINKERFLDIWDLVLSKDFEPKTYSGFGFWINPDKEIIDDSEIIERFDQTLEKSGGDIDWDYGFINRLENFAKINPEKTLKCIELYLLTVDGDLNPHRGVPMFSLDNEIKNALDICYVNDRTKQLVIDLIDKLIEKGSNVFWGLKDIIK